MTNDQICSIVLSLCHLNLEFYLLDDCFSQLRKNFDELNASNLVNLLVAGKYYINYSKHSGNLFYFIFFYFILLIQFNFFPFRFLLSSS